MITNPEFSFEPIFYLMDLNRNELSSIAVEKVVKDGYEGVSFKEDNTGWSISPIKIGKGFISNGKFDFTEDFQEAVRHASLINESL